MATHPFYINCFFCSVLLFTACENSAKKDSIEKKDTSTVVATDTVTDVAPWADAYVDLYLNANTNRLKQDGDLPLAYLKFNEIRDNKHFAAVNIGYNSPERFMTVQWIYIDSASHAIYEYDVANDSLVLWQKSGSSLTTPPLPNGTYTFEMAFAEWQGQSMGEHVSVTLNNDSITVRYLGDGELNLKKGHVLNKGILMLHKSGKWIIGHNKNDITVDEVGGCTDGPSVIDFELKKYWTC